MAFTKGELLRHSIALALRSLRLAGRRLGLTEEDRMRVADETLRELRRHGEWVSLMTLWTVAQALHGPLVGTNQARFYDDKRRGLG